MLSKEEHGVTGGHSRFEGQGLHWESREVARDNSRDHSRVDRQDALAHHHRHRKQGLTWAGSIKWTAWVAMGSSPGFGGLRFQIYDLCPQDEGTKGIILRRL